MARVRILRRTCGLSAVERRSARLKSGWERFWFAPQQTSSLALFRIAFGLVATLWTATLIPGAYAFFAADGVAPVYPASDPGEWGLLTISSSHLFVTVVVVATLAGSLALTVGWHSRLAAVVVFVGIVSLEHRNPWVTNSGDALVRSLAFYCVLAPSGAALSVDRLRTAPGRFWEFPARPLWALRLIQVQVSIAYFSAVWQKLQGQQWREGTALSYALRMDDMRRLPIPTFVTHSVALTEVFTFGTLALELALALLVWNRTLRSYVLFFGILLHLCIDYTMLIGFFSMAMLVSYLSFVPPQTATRLILGMRDRIVRRPKPQMLT
jgi:Vitamin K-dependent gamma-carboxylase